MFHVGSHHTIPETEKLGKSYTSMFQKYESKCPKGQLKKLKAFWRGNRTWKWKIGGIECCVFLISFAESCNIFKSKKQKRGNGPRGEGNVYAKKNQAELEAEAKKKVKFKWGWLEEIDGEGRDTVIVGLQSKVNRWLWLQRCRGN